MKVPGAIYIDKKGEKYVALYNFWPDIYRAAPQSINDAKNAIHTSYGYEGHVRAIDIFHCKKLPHSLADELDIKRMIRVSMLSPSHIKKLEKVDIRNNIRAEVAKGYAHLLIPLREDIYGFAREQAKNPGQNQIVEVNEIEPKTRIKRIIQKYILTSGKSTFVPSCSLEANLDYSWGCPSACLGGSLTGEIAKNSRLDVHAECKYCYAEYQHKTFWKTILDFTKEQLKDELQGNCLLKYGNGEKHGRHINILRLGKRTEAGSTFTLDSLIKTLEVCTETGTKVVLPTKYLAFDKEVAKLLKKTNSTVLYSIGWDDLERGACSHGCNNEFRLEQAKLYRDAKVNSAIYLLIDLPHPPKQRDLGILDFAKKNNIPVQLLSVRIPSKELALKITGMSWEHLKRLSSNGQKSLYGSERVGGYSQGSVQGMLLAQEIDPFWLNLLGDNNGKIRMCHHDNKETYCGSCFTDDGFIKDTEDVEIKFDKNRVGNYRKKIRDPKQGKLALKNN